MFNEFIPEADCPKREPDESCPSNCPGIGLCAFETKEQTVERTVQVCRVFQCP